MGYGAMIRAVVIFLSAGFLVQQVVAGLIRARRIYDGHDEAVARKKPVAYLFDDGSRTDDHDELAPLNSAKR